MVIGAVEPVEEPRPRRWRRMNVVHRGCARACAPAAGHVECALVNDKNARTAHRWCGGRTGVLHMWAHILQRCDSVVGGFPRSTGETVG